MLQKGKFKFYNNQENNISDIVIQSVCDLPRKSGIFKDFLLYLGKLDTRQNFIGIR